MLFPCLGFLDGGGIYGYVFVNASVVALVGSAFILFFFLWRKGRLDMDESPKFQMMSEEEEDWFHKKKM